MPAQASVATRGVKDPIHDLIEFDQFVWDFVDTRQFQRLRYIKQLGTSYYVWPGAAHNRFEHCIGVAYFARKMAEHLKDAQPELGITDRDVRCVELAGLCHDLGHGPWSHVWDSLFIPKALKGKKWKHEDASEMMFDDLVEKNGIDIDKQDADFVKALIAGDTSRSGNAPEKPFLFEIVANKRNGIDVDKFDYIMRDGHGIGDKGNLSLVKLINSARVIDNQICYNIKDANQIYELCYTRFSLHKRIYNHKTAKAIEYMIIDGLLAAEPHMKIAEQVDKPDKYVFLTDDIMTRIEMSSDPELVTSQAIFERIRKRDLYKCVDYKVFPWTFRDLCRAEITPENIVAAAKLRPSAVSSPTSISRTDDEIDEIDEADDRAVDDIDQLSADHVIVDFATMHYGMYDKNPLDSIKFYSKHSLNTCATANSGDWSTVLPQFFAEVLVRIYTRDPRFFGIIQYGYRIIEERIANKIGPLPVPPPAESPDLSLTPPATEAPSTPPPRTRTFSRTASGSFSANSFTTVPMNYAPTSPSGPEKAGKPKSAVGKRTREIVEGGSPQRKRSRK
ncbi:hypothetical protein PLICRDRAFT_151364 [Plicaturopsis crispa FD-325 SS-3]|nr:hypothetical protein PLICRDRAFT_151364 [Plicaturopsis crispa FD-325 SS-3]